MSHVLCGICFTEKIGKECIQFRKCQHSYCDDCVAGYFKSQIEDGNVKQLNCPDTSCRAEVGVSVGCTAIPGRAVSRRSCYSCLFP